MRILLLLTLLTSSLTAQHPIVPFENNTNSTPTYHEVIEYYEQLAGESPMVHLTSQGMTDAGHPLHTVILSTDGVFDVDLIRKSGKLIFFVNNAIHPGEPCGVDATMMLYRDIVAQPALQELVKDIVIVAIPIYNVGGSLNRGGYSRANQLGPEAYGFRGNAKNLDLNRDFIKADSKNAQTFNQVFTHWSPDVFVDNHTSNGADYQYIMTLISTQKDKLTPALSEYMYGTFVPDLYGKMSTAGFDMITYVNVRSTPDEGIYDFIDLPRYSSGYAAMHDCISFTSEAHMLKPYEQRVNGTYALMKSILELMKSQKAEIIKARNNAIHETKTKKQFDINWQLNREVSTPLLFKGYEAKYKTSEITGMDRLWYDRDSPWEKEIPFYNQYDATVTIEKPTAYIIPQAYTDVIDRLKWNNVKMYRLADDQTVPAEFYYIDNVDSRNGYEGHYLHYNVTVDNKQMDWQYHAGDYIVYTDQPENRYIIETLEPQAADSYFAWNFFDGILGQKEYFSSYVFEDLAAKYLAEDPSLRAELEAKKKEDPEFAKSAYRQLDFVYKRTPHYERTHRLYPVGRVMSDVQLRIE